MSRSSTATATRSRSRATINTSFCAGIMVPGTGIILKQRDGRLRACRGSRTSTGTGGYRERDRARQAPAVEHVADDRPRRRPSRARRRRSGGPLIISGVVQTVLNVVALKQPLREAVDAPRIHDQGVPPKLAIERGVPTADSRRAHEGRPRADRDPRDRRGRRRRPREDGTPVAAGDHREGRRRRRRPVAIREQPAAAQASDECAARRAVGHRRRRDGRGSPARRRRARDEPAAALVERLLVLELDRALVRDDAVREQDAVGVAASEGRAACSRRCRGSAAGPSPTRTCRCRWP